jgi:hypothetical protein
VRSSVRDVVVAKIEIAISDLIGVGIGGLNADT